MLYRDYMQKFRPLLAPDGPGGGEGDGAAAGTGTAAAAPASDASASSSAAADAAAAAPAPAADGAAAEATAPESKPSLLEAATGKPAKEAAADKPADGEAAKDPTKDAPAPADAAKPDADGDKPSAEGDKSKPEGDKEKPEGDKSAADATDPEKKEATAAAQPPVPIKYEAFKVPEGVKLNEAELGKFTEIVGAAQVPQDVAQKIVDLYIEDRGALVQELRAEQRKTWDTLNDTWKTDLRKDTDLGGNRLETTLSMAKAVIEEYGGNAEQVRELLAHTSNNGMGNFPGFVRLLHNIGVKLNVFEDGIVPANPQAPKAQKSPGNRGWYDKTNGAGGNAS